jgi:molybdenum cofactor cytidylyltransferase
VINAIVLAAGESKRMGMSKPLLWFPRRSCVPARRLPASGDARPTKRSDTTFLAQIVSVLQQSEVDGVTVVLGAQAAEIQASTDLANVDVVVNENYRNGQLSSLTAGLKSLPSRAEAILLCLVDNPLITAAMVNRVVQAFHDTGKPIVIPVFERRRGHPALFARALFDELLHAPAEEGARYVVRSHKDLVFEVEIPEPAILTRIDTPEDYLSHFGMAPRIIER